MFTVQLIKTDLGGEFPQTCNQKPEKRLRKTPKMVLHTRNQHRFEYITGKPVEKCREADSCGGGGSKCVKTQMQMKLLLQNKVHPTQTPSGEARRGGTQRGSGVEPGARCRFSTPLQRWISPSAPLRLHSHDRSEGHFTLLQMRAMHRTSGSQKQHL